METLLPGNTNAPSYSPQLKNVLKTYQLSATKSLQGPNSALLGMDCKGLLQEPPNFRFSPPTCAGNCGLDTVNEHVPIKEIEKREPSPVPIVAACKDYRLEPSHEDSDDDPPDRPKASEKRELEFQIPILTAPDQSCSERCETVLEGERISCFVVGGERRLCLPQILNTVLQDFSLPQINQVCDELQIYCSRCTRDQLEELKLSGILPRNAPSCGLITQTDAERLVSELYSRAEQSYLAAAVSTAAHLDEVRDEKQRLQLLAEKKQQQLECGLKEPPPPPARTRSPPGVQGLPGGGACASSRRFRVYHECFGKCKGIFDAECFESEDSACIECLECGSRLSPQRFVRHAHGSLENRTCHWGFDSANWRNYLLLSRDQQHYTKLANFFRDLKERHLLPNSKRKLEIQHESEKLMKKLKKDIGREEFAGLYNGNGLGLYHPVTTAAAAVAADPYLRMQWAVFELAAREASAFRPWNPAGSCKHRESSPLVPAYLSRGPPVLQHPERVVPLSESERFEPHYQPNVALAPIPTTVVPAPPPLPPLALVPPVPPSPVVASGPAAALTHRPYHRTPRLGHASVQHRSVSPEEKPVVLPVPPTPPPPPTTTKTLVVPATTAGPATPSEAFAPVSVKVERPSSPCPPAEAAAAPTAPGYVAPVLRAATPPTAASAPPPAHRHEESKEHATTAAAARPRSVLARTPDKDNGPSSTDEPADKEAPATPMLLDVISDDVDERQGSPPVTSSTATLVAVEPTTATTEPTAGKPPSPARSSSSSSSSNNSEVAALTSIEPNLVAELEEWMQDKELNPKLRELLHRVSARLRRYESELAQRGAPLTPMTEPEVQADRSEPMDLGSEETGVSKPDEPMRPASCSEDKERSDPPAVSPTPASPTTLKSSAQPAKSAKD